MAKLANPIKENRYVYDIEFSTKFEDLIKYIGKKYQNDIVIKQNYEYFLHIAESLVRYQRENANATDYDFFASLDKNLYLNNR